MSNYTLVLIAAAIGLAITGYMLIKNAKNENLWCLFGEDCNPVWKSKYAKIFGVPTYAIGFGFYVLMALVATIGLAAPGIINKMTIDIARTIAIAGFLFSCYQLGVQTCLVKKFCSWCILSMIMNLIIIIGLWQVV